MARFSQRHGYTPVRVDIQRESLDEALRNKLWTALTLTVFDKDPYLLYQHGVDTGDAALRLWVHYYKKPADTLSEDGLNGIRPFARRTVLEGEWYEALDLVETIVAELKGPPRRELINLTNSFLADEMSAYRVVDGLVAELTSEHEISAIESAIAGTTDLLGARTHLRDALVKLTSRSAPDPRNAIKEAISAVEAVCQAITGDASATLGQALKRLSSSGVALHPALEQAWSKLYGYTSDASGIRHALLEEPTVTFADAKYMLVSCAAFVSYLLQLAASAGIQVSSPKK